MELGLNIKRLRKLNQLTSRELARRVGIQQPYLSQIENGKRTPSVEALVRLAEELGVTVSKLLGETEDKLTDDMKRLLVAAKTLSSRQVDAVIGVAEAFGSYKESGKE